MTFVPGFEHDIFLSYAHLDDEKFVGIEHGWVSTLVANLATLLGQKLGRSDACFWFDRHSLRGHHDISGNIDAQVHSAALLLTVLSPAALESEWCRRERAAFAATRRDTQRRVFIIERDLIDQSAYPAELGNRPAYRFWARDLETRRARTFAVPMPTTDERDYWRRLEDLARDIAEELRALRNAALGTAETAVPRNARPAVHLAEVTDDLESARDEVRRFLDQAGILVRPQQVYPNDAAGYSAMLTRDLAGSGAFVQLLGTFPGRRLGATGDGLVRLQLDIARRHGLPILQWRSPEVDPSAVSDAQQQELLRAGHVMTMPLPRFKQLIVDQMLRPTSAAKPRPMDGPPTLFLNADGPDRPAAEALSEQLSDAAMVVLPLEGGEPSERRAFLEENLIGCDSLVLLYGATKPGWIVAQLQVFSKLSPRRGSAPRLLGLVKAPPGANADPPVRRSDLVVFDARNGLDRRLVDQLIAAMAA